VTTAIDTPQHYIPLGGSPPKLNLSYLYKLIGANTSLAKSGGAGAVGISSSSGSHALPYSVIASIIVALAVAGILYLIMARYGSPGEIRPATSQGTWLGYLYSPPYRYEGRKRVLRGLFDRIRGRMLGSSSLAEGMTVSEVAALLNSGGYLKRFAEIYNSTVFSPREPSDEEVEEARRVVSAWEGSLATSGGD